MALSARGQSLRFTRRFRQFRILGDARPCRQPTKGCDSDNQRDPARYHRTLNTASQSVTLTMPSNMRSDKFGRVAISPSPSSKIYLMFQYDKSAQETAKPAGQLRRIVQMPPSLRH
ncbi:MAG: hypothetical protein J0I80_02385 [Sphingomonas sp.]|nr:hypothetical protein [Sphingomonas sp.]